MNKSMLASIIDTKMNTTSTKRPAIPTYAFRGSDVKLPSGGSSVGNAVIKESMQYTGTKMKGIAQMHKSNAVPVFEKEDIESISKMRR